MKTCAVRTCSRPAKTKFCSRECQLVERNIDHRKMLFDLRVDMDLYRILAERAASQDMTVRDVVMNLIETEFCYWEGDGTLDFEAAS